MNNNELVTSIFLPLEKNNRIVGVFGADFTLNTVQSIANQYWNKNISFIVMDSKGSVLTSTDYKSGEYINYIDFTKRTKARCQWPDNSQGNLKIDIRLGTVLKYFI